MQNFARVIASTLAAAALFSSVVDSQQPAPVARTVLRGATVIDVVANTTVADAVIVIEGDRIAAFGGRMTPIPAGAAIVDLQVKQCRSLGSGFILVRSGANLCGRLS